MRRYNPVGHNGLGLCARVVSDSRMFIVETKDARKRWHAFIFFNGN